MILTAILAEIHVFSAILWLGGGTLFGVVIIPRLRRLSPSSSSEFLTVVGPAVVWFFRVVPLVTVLFGLLLLYDMVHEGLGDLSLSTSWGFFVTLGMAAAVVALAVSEAGAVPAFSRVIRILRAMHSTGAAVPPPELPRAIRASGLLANATLVLLLVTLAMMVMAGFY